MAGSVQATQRTGRSALAALCVVVVAKAAALTWLSVQPLWPVHEELLQPDAWRHAYGVAVSNMDVWLLGLLESLVVVVLVAVAPLKPRRQAGDSSAPHAKLCLGLKVTGNTCRLLLLAKASAVALAAPDGAWPPQQVERGTPRFVGLAAMFGSILTCLVASCLQGLLAGLVVAARSACYEATCAEHLGSGGRQQGQQGQEGQQGQQGQEGQQGQQGLRGQQVQEDEGGGGDGLLTPLLAAVMEQGAAGSHVVSTAQPSKPQPSGSSITAAATTKTPPHSSAPTSSSPSSAASAAAAAAARKALSQLLLLSVPDFHINLIAFLCGSIAALALALVPYYTGLVIDYASIEPDQSKFEQTIVTLLAAAALCGVFTGLRGGLFTVSMARLNVRLRRQLFHALVHFEMAFFDKTKTGDISSRLSADTTSVSDQISLNINVLMRSITQAALVLVFMCVASWRLTTITLIVVPLVMLLSAVYGEYFAALSKKVRAELAEANSVAEEVLSSMATVKAHAAQESSDAAYAAKLVAYTQLRMREAVAYAVYACLNMFMPKAVSALVLLYGGILVLESEMSPGSLISFMLYQLSLSDAFESIGDVFRALNASVGTADKVLELMHRQPQICKGGDLVPASFTGQIEFKDVCFHYPSRPELPVLKGLSLLVKPGEVVALVGPSGGGKSSIVKLIERFYVPEGGAVLLDGRDVGTYNNKWLRRQVALVSQEPVLYARSIRRNIIFGLEEADGEAEPPSPEEVEEAARQANAHDFIMGLPDGYDTCAGEKGSQLSGGQKQRIAIARALVRRPRVLLLDEATSALDADSEAIVQEALDRIMHGRTTLVIAHRLSTVQHAHKIVVISHGRVQEVGTHDELLDQGRTYATLVRRQLTRSDSRALASPLGSRTTSLSLASEGGATGGFGAGGLGAGAGALGAGGLGTGAGAGAGAGAGTGAPSPRGQRSGSAQQRGGQAAGPARGQG